MWRAALGVCALLALATTLMTNGCREDSVGSAEVLPPRISLPLYAVYRFTTWQLDDYGMRLPGSNRQRRWVVLSTNTTTFGYSDVTVVDDSSEHGSATVAFRFTPEGDVYQYGYLADLVQRLEGREIAPQWDLLAAYSQGWSASWMVGNLDSAGMDVMTGSSSDQELFFAVTVNGVRTIVAGYPIVLSSQSIETVLWFSENPPGVVLLQEERFPSLAGRPGTLSEISVMDVPAVSG